MKYKIEFKRDECYGCGACTCCDNWEMKDDGKATPIKTEFDEISCNQEAAEVCPASIIKIVKQK